MKIIDIVIFFLSGCLITNLFIFVLIDTSEDISKKILTQVFLILKILKSSNELSRPIHEKENLERG